MKDRRQDRARTQRRVALARAVERVESEGLTALCSAPPDRGTGLNVRDFEAQPLNLLFLDEDDLRTWFSEALDAAGLVEAALGWARHLEEDSELWRRRLSLIGREARLRARRAELDEAWRALFREHFRRWGAASLAGERVASLEADLALAALRGAERLWVEGGGRPLLPILAQEALAAVWPALYAHARKAR
ncbi:hypothetical protein GETHLI_00500 [Geothrix limicola]|uniref:MftR C-terminal domain-containing protein n=1 Tax=Geothrix limicola TaxID=2927978 RepID=A0ABQ5QAY8_9BACT|nr:hypothetical protein [Geothrix limicola]GLH71548.1 hypothetical protein GETHLI_00500 [Geothrix limicola]